MATNVTAVRLRATHQGQDDAARDLAGCATAAEVEWLRSVVIGNLGDSREVYDMAYVLAYDHTMAMGTR